MNELEARDVSNLLSKFGVFETAGSPWGKESDAFALKSPFLEEIYQIMSARSIQSDSKKSANTDKCSFWELFLDFIGLPSFQGREILKILFPVHLLLENTFYEISEIEVNRVALKKYGLQNWDISLSLKNWVFEILDCMDSVRWDNSYDFFAFVLISVKSWWMALSGGCSASCSDELSVWKTKSTQNDIILHNIQSYRNASEWIKSVF